MNRNVKLTAQWSKKEGLKKLGYIPKYELI